MAADHVSLERVSMRGMPPAPRGVSQIELTFDMDASGVLNVSARYIVENSRREMLADARNRANARVYPIEETVRDCQVV
jgi:molecular chaperone DnaK